MGLRIDTETTGSTAVVKIAGDRTGQGVRVFEQACSDLSRGLVIDLSNLILADAQAIDAIRRLRDGGAKVRNASPLIRMFLNKEILSGMWDVSDA